MELRRGLSKSGLTYRIMDDVPAWGGYFSIEAKEMYGDCEVWKKVYGCTSNKEEIEKEFNRLLSC